MDTKNDKSKKHVAFNTHLLFYLFFLAVLLLLAAVAGEDEPLFCVFFALLAAMQVFALLISPLYFVFSRDEVRIMYFFGIEKVIPWDSVRSISLDGSWINRVDGFPRYSFSYPVYCKQPFFVLGEIPKTIRTKRLVEKYYKHYDRDIP